MPQGLEWSVKISYQCSSEELAEKQAEVDRVIKDHSLQVLESIVKPKDGINHVCLTAYGCAVKSFCRQARKKLPYASVLATNQFDVIIKEHRLFRKKKNKAPLDDIILMGEKPEAPKIPEYETEHSLIGLSFSYNDGAERHKTMFDVIELLKVYHYPKIKRHEENYEKKEIYIIVAAPNDTSFYTKLQSMNNVKARRMLSCVVPIKPQDHLEELLKKTFESARKPAPTTC